MVFPFLCFLLMQASPRLFAQSITLQVKNADFAEVLLNIQRQSGYDFLYGSQLLRSARPVTLSVNKTSINDVMDKCMAG